MNRLILILICFGIPIGGLWYLSRKYKGSWLPFLCGIAAFFISQMMLRLPILSYLSEVPEFYLFTMQTLPYIIFLSCTAGLFEETARLIGFSCMRKHNHLSDAIAFGLGHGGIEAILLVGLPALFQNIDSTSVLLGGVERIFAMMAHIVFSILIWYGVRHRNIKYYLAAIVLHTLFNAIAVSASSLWGLNAISVEILIGCMSLSMGSCCYVWLKKGEHII